MTNAVVDKLNHTRSRTFNLKRWTSNRRSLILLSGYWYLRNYQLQKGGFYIKFCSGFRLFLQQTLTLIEYLQRKTTPKFPFYVIRNLSSISSKDEIEKHLNHELFSLSS